MNSKITVRMRGGMGNQMFQYAAARSLALSENAEVEIDCRDLIKKGDRNFALNYFSLMSHVKIIDKGTPFNWPERFFKKISKQLYSEPEYHFNPKFNLLKAPNYLEGYFQSEKYFLKYRKQILSDFSINSSSLKFVDHSIKNLLPPTTTVSLHVRRGDYITPKNLKIHGVLDIDYYQNAIELIKSKFGNHITICVFTDDIRWVEENLQLPQPARIISKFTNNMIQDIFLMSQCNHHIIANSSFSWWGAWLNSSAEKTVIAPQKWFGEKKLKKIDTSDLYPDSWVRI